MKSKEIADYCMSKANTYESRPFGKYPICYRVAGRIFAQLNPEPDWYRITLKCTPQKAYEYRQMFPGTVVRGYHCPPVQQPYWNTVDLNNFPEDMLLQMIDEAYEAVIEKLSKKEKQRQGYLQSMRFDNADGQNKDFIHLCERLDEDLNEIVGKKFQRQQYAQYNQLDQIHDAMIVYDGKRPICCGAFRFYDENTVEMKRVFLLPEYRGKGIARELMRRLEAKAKIQGFSYAVLETGAPLKEAMALYKKAGYQIIPNYGVYACMPDSICMSKKL